MTFFGLSREKPDIGTFVRDSTLIALFTVNSFHLHYNVIQRVCEEFRAKTTKQPEIASLTYMLDFTVMQMSSEKDYCI